MSGTSSITISPSNSVNSITVTDSSNISVVTVGQQGLAGADVLLNRDVNGTTAGASGSLVVYDHDNTEWIDSLSTRAQSVPVKIYSLLFTSGGATVTGTLDEDDLSSNSAVKLATQQSIKAYVDAQVTAQDLDFVADSGGSLSIDLDSETLTIAGGSGISTVGSSNTVTIAIDSSVATLSGSQTLTNKTLTAPVLNTVDINAGDISAATVINKSPVITLAGDLSGAVTLTALASGTLTATIAANSVALGTDTTGNYVSTIAGTTNEIEVSGSGSETAGVTIGLPDNVTIAGNLTINGSTTTVSTATLSVEDPLIILMVYTTPAARRIYMLVCSAMLMTQESLSYSKTFR